MIKTIISRTSVMLIAVAVVGLTGCASPANREAMSTPNQSFNKQYSYSVSVSAQGGGETGAMDSSNISNEDFKAAIEQSITQSQLFKTVIQGKDGDYELTVSISPLTKPMMGFSFTVDMEAGWSLVKVSDKSVVMRKLIKSSHTATMGDSMVGVTRLRMAVEGAARDNIAQGLQAIADLNLR